MLFRQMGKTGDKVSVLGYGCMRFPQINGKIDEDRTRRQIIQAIESGVNYFDTAWIYHGGKSETILGDIFSEGYRDKVRIATKLPLYLVNSRNDMEEILGKQLKKLRTNHIDYYLLHAVNDVGSWERLKRLGVRGFAEKAKKEGRIRWFGFSFHGDKEDFKAILDDFSWDMCQIQYNYIDEYFQAGREGLEYAASKGIGVVVMEPLRGGKLAGRMPQEIQQIWDTAQTKRTAADWALRWLWNQPGVSVVLSGMSEEAQIEENTKLAGEVLPGSLSEKELALYDKVKQEFYKLMRVGCTGCGYCMPCPAGVDIPFCFSYYNTRHFFNNRHAKFQYLAFAGGLYGGRPSYASLCKQCGKCERVCPQHLPIRAKLKEVSADMEPRVLTPALWLVRKYFRLRGGRKAPDRIK